MKAEIIDRGRGPEIAGTRITVYDILDYADWEHTEVAELFRLSFEQVLVARRFVEDHRDEVMAEYQKIVERSNRGNPPEQQAVLDAQHAQFLQLVKKRAQGKTQEA